MSFGRLARLLLILLVALILIGAGALVGAYFYVASSLPKVETLADYRPPIITRVLSDEGMVIAEFSRERRIVVPVAQIPRQLIEAFIAAEDSKFYEHQGIDLWSILRAAIKNIKAGGIVQGGSTITQQVAKSLLLTPERKFSRKFKEAILAWRMEQSLSKDDILYLYLNQIFLGHAAYGVQAAAENYFAKSVHELTLAECAILAGLPQAPSRYSPYRHLARAKDRQRYVLGRMVDEGYITAEQARTAEAEVLTIHPLVNSHIAESAYFTEQVRRYLETTYGEDQLYMGGLEVHSTMSVTMQQAAQRAVRDNLRAHDKRQGYRGPQQILAAEEEEAFLAQQQQSFDRNPPVVGSLLPGVLMGGSAAQGLQLRLGSHSGHLPEEQLRWAGGIRVVARAETATKSGREWRLPIGSVLQVLVTGIRSDGTLLLALDQLPEAQGALVALDPASGQVRAMVGGYDFYQSQFNRAIQARRLPGSAIKPLIYAAALDKGYTPASVLIDTPVIYTEKNESGEEVEWKPKNYADKFFGATSLRQALTHSHNVITIRILEDIGVGYAINYARKLGIQSPMARDLTFALGSSAVTPLELGSAYAVFASGGVRVNPVYITKIRDRDGKVLESTDPADFAAGPGEGQRLISQAPERVISAETAYLVTNLMESVVQQGTGWRAKALQRPVAGKTGTTNDLKDAWFVGYVPQLVTVSWIGYDQERPLGDKETGSTAAAPAWVNFMQEATKGLEVRHFDVPDNIEFRPIDPATGLLVPEDTPNLFIEAFAPGTAPTRYALDERRPRALDFFRIDMDED
jgi:penicillin-binding protein 1A